MSSALKDGCLNLYLLPRVQLQKKNPKQPHPKKTKTNPTQNPSKQKKIPKQKKSTLKKINCIFSDKSSTF